MIYMIEYCCQDFKDMIEGGLIEYDNNEPRSRGWYTREKYVIMCYSNDVTQPNAHVYMKYCLRCGKELC